MKIRLLLLTLAFSILGVFAQAHPVNGLLGYWQTEQPLYNNGVQFNLEYNFYQNQAELVVHCYFPDGAYLESSAASYASYDYQQIYVHNTQRRVSQDPYRFCEASIYAGTWYAQFDYYGRMILTVPTPYNTQFVLVRNYR
ncbi:MAG: hypothetical protein H7061_09740 [Bdellovibrionaceae bacterium]|nr:hypothetical protein [Bdellovibrio sp.]